MSEDEIVKNGLIIDDEGNKSWYKNGVLHRDDDLPAVVFSQENHKEWFQHGNKHRYTGHAVEYFNRKEFWINNEELTEVEFIYFLENKDSKEQLKKDLETNLPIHTKKGIHTI